MNLFREIVTLSLSKGARRELPYLILLNRTVFSRRHADDLRESPGKIVGVVKTHAKGNVFDRFVGEIEVLAGFLHFHLDKIVDGRIACFLLEKAGEAGRRIVIAPAQIAE